MTSDVIAAVDWILANKDAKNIRRRQLLPPLVDPRLVRLRPARQGGRAALALRCRRRRGCGQLRHERSRERRPLRAREHPFVITVGAATSAAPPRPPTTSLRPGRRTATRSTASRSPSSAPRAGTSSAPVSAGAKLAIERPGSIVAAWLHAALRHFLRGAARRRRGGAAARAPSRLDARPGQGRADGVRRHRRTPVVPSVSASSTLSQAASVQTPPNPNALASSLRGQRQLRRRGLDEPQCATRRPGTRRRGRAPLDVRVLDLRVLVERLLDVRFVVVRGWSSASWPRPRGRRRPGAPPPGRARSRSSDPYQSARAAPARSNTARSVVLQEDEPDRVDLGARTERIASIATGAASSGG